MYLLNKTKYLLILIIMLKGLNSFGQSSWQNWDAATVGLGLNKKTDLEISHQRAYDLTKSFTNSFNQSGISFDHDFTKKLSAKIGYKLTEYPSRGAISNRFLARATYKIRLAEVINWSNAIQGEVNTTVGKGNYYRVIYITRFAPRKRLNFLRLSPSISYWLYYNAGGNAIQYFDESGSPLAKQTPDGIHRGRFTLTLNSKINNNVSLSLYYMNQHEFNLAGKPINVTNPSTGKIIKPFNNFQVIGLSLAFSFDLYRKNRG